MSSWINIINFWNLIIGSLNVVPAPYFYLAALYLIFGGPIYLYRIDHYEDRLKALYYKKKYNERMNDAGPKVKGQYSIV